MARKPYPKRGKPREFVLMAASSNTDDCVIWPYATDAKGYGVVHYEGLRWRTNRLLCRMRHGPAPTVAHEAAHSCRNPSCINHRHLRWATPFENSQDKFLHQTVCRGEQIIHTKLTVDAVREIRRLRATMTCMAIAQKFGVSESNVSVIAKGKSWGWVE